MSRPLLPLLLALLASTASIAQAQNGHSPSPSTGQPPVDAMPNQVISGNPIGYTLTLFNAEYERRGGRYVTFGAGASRLGWGRDGFSSSRPYVNGDVFVRYYPSGEAFKGFAFGVKTGYTRLPGAGEFIGVGFDASHNVMLNRHFYMSTGLGMKRLLGRSEEVWAIRYIPTLRFNIGVGF